MHCLQVECRPQPLPTAEMPRSCFDQLHSCEGSWVVLDAQAPHGPAERAILHLLQPLELHGIPGRQYATGRGAVIALRELLAADHAGTLAGKEVVIQASALNPFACTRCLQPMLWLPSSGRAQTS